MIKFALFGLLALSFSFQAVADTNLSPSVRQALPELTKSLTSLQKKAGNWDGPFESDPVFDALMVLLGDKLQKDGPSIPGIQEQLEKWHFWYLVPPLLNFQPSMLKQTAFCRKINFIFERFS